MTLSRFALVATVFAIVPLAADAGGYSGSYRGGRGAVSGLRNFHRPPRALSAQAAANAGGVRAEDYRPRGDYWNAPRTTSRLYSQPVYPQPVYSQPVYSQPVHSQPPYTQPRVIVSQPSYSQPSYSQPRVVYSQPTVVHSSPTMASPPRITSPAEGVMYSTPVTIPRR